MWDNVILGDLLDKRYFLIILLILPLVSVSACIGGDENADRWNEIVEEANTYSDAIDQELVNASNSISSENYDDALDSIEEAEVQIQLLSNSLDDLEDVAIDMDNGFTEDYVDAWKNKVMSGVSYLENYKRLIYVLQFDSIYQTLLNDETLAIEYLNNFMDYYNSDSYQLALTNAQMGVNSFTSLAQIGSEFKDVSELINVNYVMQFGNAAYNFYVQLKSFLENGVLAASAALDGNFQISDNYVNVANQYFDEALTHQNTINTIVDAHPNEFPGSGNQALMSLYDQYSDNMEDARDDLDDYDDDMNDIVDDHEDFFET